MKRLRKLTWEFELSEGLPAILVPSYFSSFACSQFSAFYSILRDYFITNLWEIIHGRASIERYWAYR